MMINGIGTDIVFKKRFLDKKELIERFLTSLEINELNSNKNKNKKLDYVSGRWAAKESIIKALDKKISFSDISVLNSSTGKPEVFINKIKSNNIIVSISHEEEYAIAFSVIVKV